jgi:hypothetical protein
MIFLFFTQQSVFKEKLTTAFFISQTFCSEKFILCIAHIFIADPLKKGKQIYAFTLGAELSLRLKIYLCTLRIFMYDRDKIQRWASTLTIRSAGRRRPNFRHTIESTKIS